MSREDTAKLISLRDKLAKNEEDHGKLKEAIAKEEKRILDKAKRDNERWWKELNKEMEKLLLNLFGPDYKENVDKETILSVLHGELSSISTVMEEDGSDRNEGDTAEGSDASW